jgi:hypothetical protein
MEKSKETATKPPKKSGMAKQVPAAERCRAVLSVWTEQRTPSEVCKELSVQWTILQSWQKRAMEGMLQALEPRVNLEKGPALPPRLQVLLAEREKELLTQQSPERLRNRLAQRLASIAEKGKQAEMKPQPKEA